MTWNVLWCCKRVFRDQLRCVLSANAMFHVTNWLMTSALLACWTSMGMSWHPSWILSSSIACWAYSWAKHRQIIADCLKYRVMLNIMSVITYGRRWQTYKLFIMSALLTVVTCMSSLPLVVIVVDLRISLSATSCARRRQMWDKYLFQWLLPLLIVILTVH